MNGSAENEWFRWLKRTVRKSMQPEHEAENFK